MVVSTLFKYRGGSVNVVPHKDQGFKVCVSRRTGAPAVWLRREKDDLILLYPDEEAAATAGRTKLDDYHLGRIKIDTV